MLVAIIRKIIIALNFFFALYLIVYSTYTMVCAVFGSFKMYRYRKKENMQSILDHDYFYPISVIVPVFNENVVALQTIENLLLLDYRLFEIVVVDDGSTDNTKQLVIDKYNLILEEGRPIRYSLQCKPIKEVYYGEVNNIPIVLISKENGRCKADAVNAGINIASFPYVVNMDGDEILQKDALKYASRAILERDDIVAISGNLKMSNYVTFDKAMPVESKMGENIVVDMQVVEYGRAFVGTRIFQNELGMNLIVSGGYGIFKKSAIIEIGGFDGNSMGEDMELTMHLHEYFRSANKPYSIVYVPDSVCWTQGPETIKDLKKQRERWYCGLRQTLRKYRNMVFNPQYGLVGMFMIPYVILYELLNPFMMLVGWFVIAWALIDRSLNYTFGLYIYLLYLLFGIMMSIGSYLDKIYMKRDKITFHTVRKAIMTAVVDSLFFRVYISVISFFAFFKCNDIAKKWESPTRVVVKTTDDKG